MTLALWSTGGQHTVMLLVTYYDIKYNVIIKVGLVVVKGKAQLG